MVTGIRCGRRSLVLGAAALLASPASGFARRARETGLVSDTTFESKHGITVEWSGDWAPYTMGTYSLPEADSESLSLTLGGESGSGAFLLSMTLSPVTPEIEDDLAGYLWEDRTAGLPDGVVEVVDERVTDEGAALVSTTAADVASIVYSEVRPPGRRGGPLVTYHLSCRVETADLDLLESGLDDVEIGRDGLIEIMDEDELLETLEQAISERLG